MRLTYLPTVVGAIALAGCGATPGSPLREVAIERSGDADELLVTPSGNDMALTGTVKSPVGYLSLKRPSPVAVPARAVEERVAKQMLAITTERYTQWTHNADLRVRLEREKARLLYLQDLLRLVETSEADYMERLKYDHLRLGYSPDRHLKIFGLVRNRLHREIKRTETEITWLETSVGVHVGN